MSANSADEPWPVRTVNVKIAEWIHRLGQIWVEGQITQLSRRPGTRTAFITLRDPAADMSLTVTCPPEVIDRSPVPLVDGTRVVMCGRPSFYTGRGTVSLRVTEDGDRLGDPDGRVGQPGQAQQHGLGLVVERVPDEHHRVAIGEERPVAGGAS